MGRKESNQTNKTTDSNTTTVRLHFNEMFRVISPDVSDLTPDGVRACVRVCVCVNFRQQLRSNGASAMA